MNAAIRKDKSTFSCSGLTIPQGNIVRWDDDIMAVKFPGFSRADGYSPAMLEVVRITKLEQFGLLLHVEFDTILSLPVKNDRKKNIEIPEYWITNCESAIESIRADKDEDAHLVDTDNDTMHCTTHTDDIDEFGCPDPDCPYWIGNEEGYKRSVANREAFLAEQSDDSHLISPEDEEYREREAEYRDSVLDKDDTTDEREY